MTNPNPGTSNSTDHYTKTTDCSTLSHQSTPEEPCDYASILHNTSSSLPSQNDNSQAVMFINETVGEGGQQPQKEEEEEEEQQQQQQQQQLISSPNYGDNEKRKESFQRRQNSDCSSDSGYSESKSHDISRQLSIDEEQEPATHGINLAFVSKPDDVDSDTDNEYIEKVDKRFEFEEEQEQGQEEQQEPDSENQPAFHGGINPAFLGTCYDSDSDDNYVEKITTRLDLFEEEDDE